MKTTCLSCFALRKLILPSITVGILALAAPIHAAVVAHYSFDTNYNDSVGSNHGTAVDVGTPGNIGITTTTGQYKFGGGALSVSADKDRISLSTITLPGGTGNGWSVSFWSKGSGVALGQNTSSTNFIWMNSASQYPRLRASNTTTDFTGTVTSAWLHTSLVSDGSNVTIYRNGAFVETKSNAGSLLIDSIGDGYTFNTTNISFVGQIDEVWLFNAPIDAATVQSLYNTNAIPEPGAAMLGALGLLLLLRRRR